MQICLGMLSDELKKGLCLEKTTSTDHNNRLQILVLIEAYEGVLESCKKELGRPPVTRGADNEEYQRRRKKVKEVARMVDLWLDALYGVYDEGLGVGMI